MCGMLFVTRPGRDVPIWYIASEAVRGSRDTGGYKRGKVYRPMYGFQEEKAAHLGDDWKSMPLLFYHPYMKDVSYAYYPDTLRILTGIPDDEVCYLAHFHEAHWWSWCLVHARQAARWKYLI